MLTLWLGGECYEFTRPIPRLWARTGSAASVAGTVTSPMPGKIIKARAITLMLGVAGCVPIQACCLKAVLFLAHNECLQASSRVKSFLMCWQRSPSARALRPNDSFLCGLPDQVLVKDGDMVAEGDALVVLEAMKMEHTVVAPCNGQVGDRTQSVRSPAF